MFLIYVEEVMTEKLSLRKEMELQMDGKLPIERQHPKEGQSQWYYVDPRGRGDSFTLLSEAKTIDVPTKDTPNPYLQDIMREDADKYPENYYVWHTVGDDRVRSSHEERDGKIFAWDDAPEGGHPGEDYNCRCTAEPYSKNSIMKKAEELQKINISLTKIEDSLADVNEKLNEILLVLDQIDENIILEGGTALGGGIKGVIDGVVDNASPQNKRIETIYNRISIPKLFSRTMGRYGILIDFAKGVYEKKESLDSLDELTKQREEVVTQIQNLNLQKDSLIKTKKSLSQRRNQLEH